MKKIFLDKEGLKRYTDNMKAYIANHGGEATSVDIADIDFSGKIEEFIKGNLPTRYKVVQTLNTKTYSVGQMYMFSDNMGHQITQVLVTNMVPTAEGKINASSAHRDGKMYQYYRFYNHAMASTESGIVKGTWSEWRPGADDYVLEAVKTVSKMANENVELVTPTISGTFTVKTASGTQSSTSTNNSLDVENGFMVDWTGTFLWKRIAGKKTPESVSGNWTTLPASGVASKVYTATGLKVDTTISATLAAAKTGLMVSGSSVVLAKGNDTKTATAKVRFLHRRYWGLTTEKTVTAAVVKALSGTDLNNTKVAKLTSISATDSQYYVIAYPKAMGELSKIVQNGATPLLDGGFVKSEVSVTNAAGVAIDYYVYRTDKPGALKNNSFLEIA